MPGRLAAFSPRPGKLRGVVDGCNLFPAGAPAAAANLAWTGIGKGKGKSPAGFRRFRLDGFRMVERGVANEVKRFIDFANRTYALDGFNVVSFQTVKRIAGTCVTGCAIVDSGPAGKPPVYNGFTSRLAKCAEKADELQKSSDFELAS